MSLRIISRFFLLLLFLCSYGLSSYSQVESRTFKLAKNDTLNWTRHLPGGDTGCALGSDFHYFTREASPDSLLIYFVGGGACWSGEQCNPSIDPTPYTYQLGKVDEKAVDGIFNPHHPDNPFTKYTILAIPTCTGDLFLGNSTTQYQYETDRGDLESVTVYHRGYINAMAALQWAFQQAASPNIVVVGGSSAGGVAAPLYANIVANHYTEARVIGIGDAAGAYRSEAMQGAQFDNWNIGEAIENHTAFKGLEATNLGIEDLYIKAASQTLPNLELYQVDQAYDQRQEFFLRLAGYEAPDVMELIKKNREEISRHDPDFRSFLLGGNDHTIFTSSRYYFFQSEEVLFQDWISNILKGEKVSNISCTLCQRPRLKYTATDLKIIEEIKALIPSEKRWNANDRYPKNPNCRVNLRGISLRCAVTRAVREVTQSTREYPVNYAFSYTAYAKIEDNESAGIPPIVAYNNQEGRSFEEIVAIINEVEDEIRRQVE